MLNLNRKAGFVVIFSCVTIAINSCNIPIDNSRNVRDDLMEVVKYYRDSGDSLGVDAALFLIKGMPGQGTYDSNLGAVVPDEEQVEKEYLIRSINASLESGRLPIRQGLLRKQDFFEYVLPHRLGSEPLTDWKSECVMEYPFLKSIAVSVPYSDSLALEKIRRVNAGLIDHFTYQTNFTNADNLSWRQLMSSKSGDCVVMTNTITYPLRAAGIPVAIDFTPAWGNANGSGHSWNTLITHNAAVIPFLGFEGSPPQYSPFRIHETLKRVPAKVFRKTYSANADLLATKVGPTAEIPRSLNFTRAIDVTNRYVQTDDIRIKLASHANALITDSTLYLSCFSYGKWTPVFWSRTQDDTFLFKAMATNVLYISSTFNKKEGSVPIDYPFAVTNGIVKVFKPDLNNRREIVIENTRSKEMDALALFGLNISKPEFYKRIREVMHDKALSVPADNKTYRLYYWDGDWKLAGMERTVKNKKLTFRHVPKNAIYRLLTTENGGKTERIFSFSDKQDWW